MAEGVGNAPTSAMPILFSGQVQPAYICLPSTRYARIADSRLPISKDGNDRALGYYVLAIGYFADGAGCQGWTRTNTERLNRPPCYFDTTWQSRWLQVECYKFKTTLLTAGGSLELPTYDLRP
jgi:hypothetical protein